MSKGRSAAAAAALGITLVLGTTTACAREEAGTPTTAAPNATTSVELLDPGAEPREALRFTVTEGAQSRATMITTMQISTEVGGEPMQVMDAPPMLFDMSATVDAVTPDGDIQYTTTMDDFGVGDGTNLPPDAMGSIGALSGLTGTAVMTATGEHSDTELDIPADVDPEMRRMIETMAPELNAFSVRFPSEPIGVGAIWLTHTTSELNGIQTDVTTTYTLQERTGDRYRTEISYDQSAPEQEIEPPGIPAEVHTQVTEMAISGSGEIEGSLSELFPLTATIRSNGTINMAVDDGESSDEMHQTLDLTMSIESTP